ncbi:zinc finger protein OZF-like [Melanotaenia boesemani]|uniref:zinc finger protein OZF-like n=1 Tax=Melanotaenia boesemani TaxID=1250792 RepID=UPI001C03F2FB|nr:zinc finger protein OZF-like [Melanotaenia boesemani]
MISDDRHVLGIKEEIRHECSSSQDQNDPERHHIKEEEEELWTIKKTEPDDGLEEQTINQLNMLDVKNEDDDQSPQLQRQTDQDIVADCPTSCSVQQIQLESNVNTDETQQARKPRPDTTEKTSESSETEVSDDEDFSHEEWQKPLSHSGAETEDSDNDCKQSGAPVSGENNHTTCDTVKIVFSCFECSEEFLSKRSLQRHMRSHPRNRSSRCLVKKKSLKVNQNIDPHVRVHTGEKSFACDVCGKRFTKHCILKRHMRVHTGEKPFACDVCRKRFTQHFNLKTHMRVHTGDKPFACDVCGKRFTRHDTLKLT